MARQAAPTQWSSKTNLRSWVDRNARAKLMNWGKYVWERQDVFADRSDVTQSCRRALFLLLLARRTSSSKHLHRPDRSFPPRRPSSCPVPSRAPDLFHGTRVSPQICSCPLRSSLLPSRRGKGMGTCATTSSVTWAAILKTHWTASSYLTDIRKVL